MASEDYDAFLRYLFEERVRDRLRNVPVEEDRDQGIASEFGRYDSVVRGLDNLRDAHRLLRSL